MSSIDITMTGAAGAAPTPAVVVRPSLGACAGVLGRTVLGGAAVRMEQFVAPQGGTGLSTAERIRPWGPAVTGVSIDLQHSAAAVLGGYAPIALRPTSSTPGDLPPRDPLS